MKAGVFATLLILAVAPFAFADLTPGPVVVDGLAIPIIADLDGNGLTDVVLDRSVLLNIGNGQFVTRDLGIPASERVIDCLDLNGDGRPDLLTQVLSSSGPGQTPSAAFYRIHLAGEQMTYGAGIPINTGGAVPYIADVNGDGKEDLVLFRAVFQGIHEVYTEVTVLLSRGDGTFDARAPFQTVTDPQFGRYNHHLLAADLNHDGNADIVLRSVSELVVLRGNGDGTFVPQTRFLPQEPFGWWTTALADIDRDGNLDVVMAGFRSVRVLFGDGHGGFTRVASASLPRLRTVTVPFYLPAAIDDRAQAPRNVAFGEFVQAGRTEIAAGTAEGDVVILALVQGRLQEVARTQTELVLPDLHAGAFRQPGKVDLYVTWNAGYGAGTPKPRLFYSQPSPAVSAVSQSRGRGRAVRPPDSSLPSLTFSIKTNGACAPAEATALMLTHDGMFGMVQDSGQTLEAVIDDEGTLYVRLDAPWLTSPIVSTLSATAQGYEGTAAAITSCGQQSVSFVAAR